MTKRDNPDDPSLVRSGNVPEDDDRDALIDAMPGAGRLNEATDADTVHDGDSDESTREHEPEVADEIKPTGPAPAP
jgi:hypothetical protein